MLLKNENYKNIEYAIFEKYDRETMNIADEIATTNIRPEPWRTKECYGNYDNCLGNSNATGYRRGGTQELESLAESFIWEKCRDFLTNMSMLDLRLLVLYHNRYDDNICDSNKLLALDKEKLINFIINKVVSDVQNNISMFKNDGNEYIEELE